MYRREISKEEVQNLPIDKYKGTVSIIDSPDQVEAACIKISRSEIIGIDTETKPAFKKGVSYKTALVQIAIETEVFLFRLNKIGLPQPLIKIFSDHSIEKIGIAVVQDFKELSSEYRRFNTQSVVDLNILCKTMGFENIGAKNLSAMVLGHNISKRQQTSNWENKELTEAQISYAATDAWICREIYLRLIQE